MRIDIEEAGKELAKLGSYAQTGEKVVITKDGEPYLELIPCHEVDTGKAVRRTRVSLFAEWGLSAKGGCRVRVVCHRSIGCR